MYRLATLFVLLVLTGCSSTLALSLAPGERVNVVSGARESQLSSSDAGYKRLQRWLAQNQGGWSQVYATNPNGGILVAGGTLRLQFVGSAVFALTDKGVFTKPVETSEYAFLIALPSI